MARSKARVARVIVEDTVFGYTAHPVSVTGGYYDAQTESFVFEIEGEDVPPAGMVVAQCTLRCNRAQQRLIEMTFQPVGEP